MCVCVCVCVCLCACIFVGTCIWGYVRMYICMHACVCLHVCMYVYLLAVHSKSLKAINIKVLPNNNQIDCIFFSANIT